jgi:pentatricopeptide repeat protein
MVDMYVKCGLLSIAQRVFERLCDHDVVSWTVLMAGYAQQGQSENAFDLFDRMVGEGTLPNMVTFIVLLSACNRRGLYNTSQSYFEAMSKDYGILPSQKHHNCVVDLLGKAGRLDEALTTLQETPFGSNLVTCHAILSACRKWGEVNLARQTFEYALQLDRTDSVAYVLMSHVYADAKS